MTDYAAILLSLLAYEQRHDEDTCLSAADISGRTGLSQPTVAKILKMLAAADLVSATRGKSGGYALMQDPASISVAAIIEALEGPIALTACVETSVDACASRYSCFLGGNWERVNVAIADALASVTLADLVNPDSLFAQEGVRHPSAEVTTGSDRFHVGNS
ncbi:SUF system Fe-S cluster assembly regulator [Alphaproteobacteria bacterium LSUCC0684]